MVGATAGAAAPRPSTPRSAPSKNGPAPRARSTGAPPPADDPALEQQRAEFDMIARYQAEMYRELNVLRDMMLEQMKHDDEYLKAMIRLI